MGDVIAMTAKRTKEEKLWAARLNNKLKLAIKLCEAEGSLG